MNNVSCKIIQDLLPLYCDGVCSEESQNMIREHLQTCDKCKEELRLMSLPMEIPKEKQEIKAAKAASKVWKKYMRKAFRAGVILALLLVMAGAAIFLYSHYTQSCSLDDKTGLLQQLQTEDSQQTTPIHMQDIVQKGDYLTLSAYDDDGMWYLGIYRHDDIFSDRWVFYGSLEHVRPNDFVNWNYQTPNGDTILICFGADLSPFICGYTFTNSGVTYTCPVEGNTVLDFFFIPDSYDPGTHLEPIFQTTEEEE